jgi:sialic acid synthase SpsE
VEDEMSHIAKSVKPEHADSSIYEIMERCSLSEVEENELKQYVESKGMIFISTPFSRAAADRLERMGVVAYKIGSGEMNNLPLISHIASFKKPLIVSTGMNDISSVRNTVELLRRYNIQFALLHTTNLYPTPSELVRLGAMQELMREFPDLVVGLSDHTINNNACLAATALGASILERHFTDSKKRSGPDISCSMDPNELRELINSSNEVFKMRGGNKIPVLEEKATMDFAFSTVVTIKDVNEGEIFDMSNIWVKRPGIGEIPADQYEYIIGKKAKKFLPKDIHLTRNDIEK